MSQRQASLGGDRRVAGFSHEPGTGLRPVALGKETGLLQATWLKPLKKRVVAEVVPCARS